MGLAPSGLASGALQPELREPCSCSQLVPRVLLLLLLLLWLLLLLLLGDFRDEGRHLLLECVLASRRRALGLGDGHLELLREQIHVVG